MFENKRSDRVGDLLQREIAELLIRRVKDPRLHSVTITQVKVSRDLRHAWVYYNILSGGPTKDSVEIGLARAHGFIKRELGRRLRLRYLPNIEFLWDTVVESIEGGDFVQNLRVRNVKSGQQTRLDLSGIFISIGIKPNTGYLKDLVPMDTIGAIITNDRMETGIPGIFAAGDIRHNSIWQVIAAAGDGAIAAIAAEKYLTG